MEKINLVLSGLGGQGILFMTKLLARTAVDKGFKILVAETHGMAQRGGSVVSHLRVGDVKGSLVRAGSAHILLALEENEAYRNIPFLARGGGTLCKRSKTLFPPKRGKAVSGKDGDCVAGRPCLGHRSKISGSHVSKSRLVRLFFFLSRRSYRL
jgi:indolepyruvate ferredoxin oxidoreductase beta subunit